MLLQGLCSWKQDVKRISLHIPDDLIDIWDIDKDDQICNETCAERY